MDKYTALQSTLCQQLLSLSSDGQLVARYHKQNPYFEDAFDTPPQPEIVTFDTPFAGRFGLIICFDILFHMPTVVLLEKVRKSLCVITTHCLQLLLTSAFLLCISVRVSVS